MKTLITTIACTFIAASAAFAGDYADVSLEDLKEAIQENKVVLLDVNGTPSYKKGHIPGAIDYRASKDKLAELLPEDKETLVVAYCGGPSCQAYKSGAKAAEKLGYTNVKHFSAGISGWLQAGEETEKVEKAEKAEKS